MNRLARLGVIGAGGALGTLLRVAAEHTLGTHLGVLLVNVLGALIIGGTLGLIPLVRVRTGPLVRLGVATGFCGGLTTLSTLAMIEAEAVSQHALVPAMGYAALTLAGGVVAALIGQYLARAAVLGGGATREA
jgi:CrcB protein